jgi:hypothetical protein
MTSHEARLSPREQTFAIRTWRYLRLAMIGLVGGLAFSVLYERIDGSKDCWQTSISGYYYTHAQPYFVGALIAVGVCMFCLKGNTEAEDVLLNLAGMFAPVVALVPTTDTGKCGTMLGTPEDRVANVDNNMWTLIFVGAVALVLLAALAKGRAPSRAALAGYLVAAGAWLLTTVVFLADRDWFRHKAHYAAAAAMFACIIAVVWINSFEFSKTGKAASMFRNQYAFIAWGMGSSLVLVPIGLIRDWAYWVIVLEAAVIALFALFWGLQTKELWGQGLREPHRGGRAAHAP